jgi:hypothetical protein
VTTKSWGDLPTVASRTTFALLRCLPQRRLRRRPVRLRRSVHAACRCSWSTSLDSRLTVHRRHRRSDNLRGEFRDPLEEPSSYRSVRLAACAMSVGLRTRPVGPRAGWPLAGMPPMGSRRLALDPGSRSSAGSTSNGFRRQGQRFRPACASTTPSQTYPATGTPKSPRGSRRSAADAACRTHPGRFPARWAQLGNGSSSCRYPTTSRSTTPPSGYCDVGLRAKVVQRHGSEGNSPEQCPKEIHTLIPSRDRQGREARSRPCAGHRVGGHPVRQPP